jgi:hypothetical protein
MCPEKGGNFFEIKMADNTNHSNNENVKSLANSSTVLISDNVISLNVEDQYDLRWPTSQERDFTQIITEDTATKSNINCDPDGRQEKELKQCSEVTMQPRTQALSTTRLIMYSHVSM